MGSDDTGRGARGGKVVRLTRTALACIFVGGVVLGIVITFGASLLIGDDPDEVSVRGAPSSGPSSGASLLAQAYGKGGMKQVSSPSDSLQFPAQPPEGFWIETVSDVPKSRIFILHNVVTANEAKHLKSLGLIKGMEKALIIPYGQKDLVESDTRTNTAAWLDFAHDHIVERLERLLAEVTKTTPEHGENLQILHYESQQKFSEHHDYFDPDEDPPENFEPGGNRKATALVYLQNARVGGETEFHKLGLKLKPDAGDVLLFFDTLPDGRVDKNTMHTGTPPSDGEKWVATKWIHERTYQGLAKPDRGDGHPK
eukprot:CAMPEP_0174921132 /NCGR_PEP_ID=MMETSP1355-20121228/4939_1 /TAXON_ID=464990 /ORGANISM="Hemiselmis tepida, Strain CCMP443" /LENGTH=311 /DNA_ID=CAMNT_0016166581 /DNA_START=53 /DNA_END=985 /DNA_ORIENTATION=+